MTSIPAESLKVVTQTTATQSSAYRSVFSPTLPSFSQAIDVHSVTIKNTRYIVPKSVAGDIIRSDTTIAYNKIPTLHPSAR